MSDELRTVIERWCDGSRGQEGEESGMQADEMTLRSSVPDQAAPRRPRGTAAKRLRAGDA